MDDPRLARQRWTRGPKRRDHLLIAEQNEFDIRSPLERNRRRIQHDGGAVVATHRVERYANVFFHPNINPEARRRAGQ